MTPEDSIDNIATWRQNLIIGSFLSNVSAQVLPAHVGSPAVFRVMRRIAEMGKHILMDIVKLGRAS